jgi:o-succinylbenzoate synthase
VRIRGATLHTIELPLVAPFTTAFGTMSARQALLVELRADIDDQSWIGWGECTALAAPLYSSEYLDGSAEVIRRYLLPMLAEKNDLTAERVADCLRPIRGHRMAKAAVEMAVLDIQLRSQGISFAAYLGVERDLVPSGVSVGIHESIDDLISAVAGYLEAGYMRIKLKIRPGQDIEPVRAIRSAFGDDLTLQVDANAAYTLGDAAHLKRLDAFGLVMIEQPLGEEDLRQHAVLARHIATPICLDESIVSAQAAADAIALGAAAVINIKAGRVGGYLEARRIHDLARATGAGVWCGGMLETGLGRAANVALAALPGFNLIGDISASDRFYAEDITVPMQLEDGHVRVPNGPGFGVEPIKERIEEVTRRVDVVSV